MLRRDHENQSIVPYIPPSGSSSSSYRPPLLQSPTLHMPLPLTFNIGTPPRSSRINIGTPLRSSPSSSSSFRLTPELKQNVIEQGSLSPMLAIQDIPPLPLGSGQTYATKPRAVTKRRLR